MLTNHQRLPPPSAAVTATRVHGRCGNVTGPAATATVTTAATATATAIAISAAADQPGTAAAAPSGAAIAAATVHGHIQGQDPDEERSMHGQPPERSTLRAVARQPTNLRLCFLQQTICVWCVCVCVCVCVCATMVLATIVHGAVYQVGTRVLWTCTIRVVVCNRTCESPIVGLSILAI
jgi:hypothetical protein